MSDDHSIDALVELLSEGAQIGPPVNEADIVRAEAALGRELPALLKVFYRRCGHLVRPDESVNPLIDPVPFLGPNTTLVGATLFVHSQHEDCDVADYVFFGGSARPYFFGMSWDTPTRFIRFFGYMDEPEIIEGDIVELYRQELAWGEECREMRRRHPLGRRRE